MKHSFLTKIIIISCLLGSAVTIFAAEANYTLLEPGVFGGGTTEVTSFNDYASLAFTAILGIAIALAILMIVLGGFQYITSATGMGKEDGKGKIKDALTGLAIILLSWLALYTINPDLVNWNFKVDQLGTQTTNPPTP
jgi:hypothetical protein